MRYGQTMMRGTYLKLLAFLMLAAFLVLGCTSQSAAPTPAPSPSPTPAPAPADKFPEKPVTLIVNFGAGGATDLSVRPLAESMSKILGVPVAVVNKGGGAGTVGVSELSVAKNDGYTMGTINGATLNLAPHIQGVPYDPLKAFEYLGTAGRYRYGIGVLKDSPYQSLKDIIEAARKEPGKISYSSTGLPNIYAVILLEQKENIKATYVPFTSGPESVNAVLGGHVDFVVQTPSAFKAGLESGDIRLVVSVTDRKWPTAPDAPSLKDLGYDIDIAEPLILAVPAGVPENRVKILRDAFDEAMKDPRVTENLERMELADKASGPDEIRKWVETTHTEYEKAVEQMGLK